MCLIAVKNVYGISRHPLSIIRTTCSKNIIADNLHRQKVKSFKLGGVGGCGGGGGGGGNSGNVGMGV